MTLTKVNLPDPAEVRRRIEKVKDPQLNPLLKTIFLFNSSILDIVGKIQKSEANKIHPVIGLKGTDVKEEQVFIQRLDRETPVCFFEVKNWPRKAKEPISRRIALPKEFERWTSDLVHHFKEAGNNYVFDFDRQTAQKMMEAEEPFKDLPYPVGYTGEPKDLKTYSIDKIRIMELRQEYGFDLEELVAYGNVNDISISKDLAMQFDCLTSPKNDLWEVYVNKLCKVMHARNYTIDEFVSETGYDKQEITKWGAMLRRKKHLIFQGPPGTGKSFVSQLLADYFLSEMKDIKGVVKRVQFHPDYSYEDFVQGYFPETRGASFQFELRKGIFRRFCEAAQTEPDSRYVLIIDEINRANVSRVFGELMYLLEYREDEIILATGGKPFHIPENVYIIGTMNTADRTIALVDHALRRRFSFVRLKPEYDILIKHLESYNFPTESLKRVLEELNKTIDNPNYEVGISFFLNDREHLKERLPIIWESEIEPYLEEYFYDQPDKVDQFRWKALVKNELNEWAIDAGH